MTTAQLFEVTAADVALTTDDWYTPRWIFDAAGLVFDMDVCAPVAPEFRTCPARRYLTVVEDGLTSEWHGTIWCNPPYSKAAQWAPRWIKHPSGLALVLGKSKVGWLGPFLAASDAVAFLSVEFGRPDGSTADLTWPLILVAKGSKCVAALARVAAADKYAAGAYHVRPNRAGGS